MRRQSKIPNETFREYAALLENANYAYPSWRTSYYGDDDDATHVEMFSYTEYPTSLGDKSNFRVARDLIRCAADEGYEGTKRSQAQVIEIDGSPVHYGSAYSLYVQVYEHGKKRKGYTAAFREAVALAEYAKYEYPFLDESDHGELEDEVFNENLEGALDEACREYPDDTDEDRAAITEHALDDLYELKYQESEGEVSWIRSAEIYAEHRDAHFCALANEHMNAPIEGQLALV
ncbi:hypothetical protein [Streptomyces sp. x-19]|uniref:hypothetical protein n=1 Tax=Streptomyces sp. x-19 TaxID=2789280 RepID=UPI00397F73DA